MTLTTRRSRPIWELTAEADPASHEGLDRGFYIGMLLDDLGNRHYAYETGLELVSPDQRQAEEFVAAFLIELSQYGREPADHLFWDLVETVCWETVMYRRCTAEVFLAEDLVEDGDESIRPNAAHPRLAVLPGWSLKRTRLRTWQVEGEGWRSLDRATLLETELKGRVAKSLGRAVRDLSALDRNPLDRQILMSLGSPTYDVATHQRRLHELAGRATSSLGWDGRGLFMERATDSLKLYRELRFLQTWLEIVGSVKTMLVKAIRLAQDDSAPTDIKVTGLPTLTEVEDAMAAVREGTESLDSIRNRLIYPRYA